MNNIDHDSGLPIQQSSATPSSEKVEKPQLVTSSIPPPSDNDIAQVQAVYNMTEQMKNTALSSIAIKPLDLYEPDSKYTFSFVRNGKTYTCDARDLYEHICRDGLPRTWKQSEQDQTVYKLNATELTLLRKLANITDPKKIEKFNNVLEAVKKDLGNPRNLNAADRATLGDICETFEKAVTEDDKAFVYTSFLLMVEENQISESLKIFLENTPISTHKTITHYVELLHTSQEQCLKEGFKPLKSFLLQFKKLNKLNSISEE